MVPTVLVVDDDLLIRWSLRQALEARGLRVLEAGCSAEAVLVARLQDVCVAVLDWSLPDGDGLALLPVLARERPGCRSLLLTAYASEELTSRALAAGCAQVLAKPFEIHDLVERVVAEVLASHTMRP